METLDSDIMNEFPEDIDYRTVTESELEPLLELWQQSLFFHSQLDERLSKEVQDTSSTREYYKETPSRCIAESEGPHRSGGVYGS